MTAFWSDPHLTIHGGDCREVLATLPERSVHTVVTSPPYWGLRDYGTATWDGGDAACSHEPSQEWIDHNFNANSAFGSGAATQSAAAKGRWYKPDGSCRCGARRVDSQLGLEATPEEYVASMVAVFREVRRVLRDDGTLWLNLGDSYATGGMSNPSSSSTLEGGKDRGARDYAISRVVPLGLKPKDLVGIPWRVAFALQADGWYLRSDIIWSKPNPMPESVTDRPTKAHEYLFLLTKSPRYYYDADAVREAMAREWDPATNGGSWAHTERQPEGSKAGHHSGPYPVPNPAGRNLRSVWTIATEPYPGAHFATFPRKLVEPCIKAGSPEGGVVLDPFAGSGTTLLVAQALGRRAIGIDLNPDYLRQCLERNRQVPLGLGAA